MSEPIDFADDGRVFGILYSLPPHSSGTRNWAMSFYGSEKGRRRGIAYLNREFPDYRLYSFELTFEGISALARIIPVPDVVRTSNKERLDKRYRVIWQPKG